MMSGATGLDQGKKIALTEIRARRENLETNGSSSVGYANSHAHTDYRTDKVVRYSGW